MFVHNRAKTRAVPFPASNVLVNSTPCFVHALQQYDSNVVPDQQMYIAKYNRRERQAAKPMKHVLESLCVSRPRLLDKRCKGSGK